ncbi:NlpC/P60 family protein [Bradyrhizobium yuanmingense]|uniref:NlpC/P60 family protein n=1 Tax=Bradyrhizobium yuanmingense TaxID=108015 RepID=UPI0012FC816F|nr:NlpC/P60 family protein [Bradyrhizobium yuanmingense]
MKTPDAKLTLTTCDSPDRVEVFDRETGAWCATFTLGSYTVSLSGPPRQLRDARRHVETGCWVRIYPQPFDGGIDADWLNCALRANGSGVPDVLAIALQYVAGSRRLYAGGLQIAGNARYGPRSHESRQEGSDFNDYLGIVWEYPNEPMDRPETRQIRSLDCSGFVRMVYGYRRSLPGAFTSTIPLCRAARVDNEALPRRAHEIFTSGPGVVLIDNVSHSRPAELDVLLPGDLLFFDADSDDGVRLDHVAIYLGLDTKGRRRFISSRKRANGPTMEDIGGRSILDGDGLYARAFRAARRL